MCNRKRIMKFCTDRGLTVISLIWERGMDYAYGDSWDTSCWNLTVLMNGEQHLYAPEEDTTEKAIQQMFEEIEDDIKESKLNIKFKI